MEKTEATKASKLGPGNYRRIARISGYTPRHVSRVLRGLTGVTLESAGKIADAAGVSVDEVRKVIAKAREMTSE